MSDTKGALTYITCVLRACVECNKPLSPAAIRKLLDDTIKIQYPAYEMKPAPFGNWHIEPVQPVPTTTTCTHYAVGTRVVWWTEEGYHHGVVTEVPPGTSVIPDPGLHTAVKYKMYGPTGGYVIMWVSTDRLSLDAKTYAVGGTGAQSAAPALNAAFPPEKQRFWRCEHHPSAIDNWHSWERHTGTDVRYGCRHDCHKSELRWSDNGTCKPPTY